ncbi:MAG: sulfotransferase [Ornithinimicrobium sp.]
MGRFTPADRIDRFRLDKDTVLGEATRATGLTDFGDLGFEEGLDALLDSIEQDIDPHLVGQIALRQTIVDGLTNRLLLAREHRDHPEVFEAPLRPPIVVTGLHRSGTTHLHRLLAQDPGNHAPPYWQLVAPIPRGTGKDTRRWQAQRSLAVRTALMPNLSRMHTIDADAPEECLYLLASTFDSVFFWAMAPVTGYLQWYLQHDRTQKYREYRAWLQILQRQTPTKRLVLKAPEHMGAVDALLRAIPEAHVVHIHRDPVTSFASYLSMAKTTQSLTVTEVPERATADAALDLFAQEIERHRVARELHSSRIHDVDYSDMVADPLATISDLYDSLHTVVSAPFEARLAAYARSHPIGRHGEHSYSLARGDLDRDTVQRRLAS